MPALRGVLGPLIVVALLAASPGALATPTQELQEARAAFQAGQFEEAVPLFVGLLYPDSRLADAGALAEAHLLLGVSYFETGKPDAAEREFEEALFLDPTLSLSESLFSTGAVRFFEKTKRDLERRARDAAEKERLARKAERLRRAFDSAIFLEKRRYFVNFIPFGAGQFQNGQKRKGAFFFISEALTGGTSAALFSYQVIRYGFSGVVPREEVDTVRALQTIQITSGALFFGLMAWGIIDSLANYEHTVRREADPAVLEDLEEILGDEPTSSLHLVPTFTDDSAGVTVQWEF